MHAISELHKIFTASKGVQTDTRNLKEGELFVALKGENFNGNLYADNALKAGAIGAIVDEEEYVLNDKCYLVTDGLTALQELAKYHRQQFDFPILAITGSNGKTTTKELLAVVLSKKYNVLATVGNFNNHIGVPLTLLQLTNEHNFALIEMGANHQGEIASYCQWALPNYALINNCGKAHLEGFGGIEGVRKGKGELFDFIKENGGTIFRNADLEYLIEMSSGIDAQVTYGQNRGDYIAKIYEHEPFVSIAVLNQGNEQIIKSNLVGDYNLANMLAAVAVGKYFGVELSKIKEAIESYVPTNNRSEHKVVNGVNVILDAYNANPTSMKAALQSFANTSHAQKIVMLGAMMELGDNCDEEHNDVLRFALNHTWKEVITVGKKFKNSATQNNVLHYDTATEAKEWFTKNAKDGDWVYIKGSRLTAMEKIIE
jgi:UDP-N-acetylmuramoyl-tripeptide--D-alanyl-D-alanine ligase